MKLINTRTGLPLVTIKQNGAIEFHHPMLAHEIEDFGVTIPVYLRDQFDNKEKIFLDDPDFIRAFRDVYYTHHMDRDLYKWEQKE